MRRNTRQEQINRLRQQQRDNDWFFDRFDNTFDKAFDNPVGFFAKFGLLAIVLNLIFWGAIIAMVVFGLSFIL